MWLSERGSPAPSPPFAGGRVTGGSTVRRNLGDRTTSVASRAFLSVRPARSRNTRASMDLRVDPGASGARSARRSLTVRPCAQTRDRPTSGVSPPTSPVESGGVLQPPNSLFLPWVLFPFEALSTFARNLAAPLSIRRSPVDPSRHRFPGSPSAFSSDFSWEQRFWTLARGPSVRGWGQQPSPVVASLGFLTSKSDCHDFEVRGVFPRDSALAALSVWTVSPSVVDRKSVV